MKSEFLKIMEERGFIQICTDLERLDEIMASKKITAYIGFDCTAPSLHIGSLIQIMILRWLQRCGHTPIVLLGGATTRIGDPSGKDESRKILSEEQIQTNMAGIKKVFESYLSFDDSNNAATIVNNAIWMEKLNFLDMLQNCHQHFSVNRMMTMDSVRNRMEREQHLSLMEFNYMVLQAYDFVYLRDTLDCILQIGGSDQWSNIINGIELGRKTKKKDSPDLFGIVTPLLTTSAGIKMGKTSNGAIWLNEDMLSTNDFWQFWRNVEDADVGRFLRLFTELDLEEISRLENFDGKDINEAKKILATEVTALCRGRVAAVKAEEVARKIFEEKQTDDLPVVKVERHRILASEISVADLVQMFDKTKSKSEIKKLMANGAIKFDDHYKVFEPDFKIHTYRWKNDELKVSVGKKTHFLVKLV